MLVGGACLAGGIHGLDLVFFFRIADVDVKILAVFMKVVVIGIQVLIVARPFVQTAEHRMGQPLLSQQRAEYTARIIVVTVDVKPQFFAIKRVAAVQHRQSHEFVHAVWLTGETAEKIDQIIFQQAEMGLFRVTVAHLGVAFCGDFELSVQVVRDHQWQGNPTGAPRGAGQVVSSKHFNVGEGEWASQPSSVEKIIQGVMGEHAFGEGLDFSHNQRHTNSSISRDMKGPGLHSNVRRYHHCKRLELI
ncbi:hypothetical protein JFV26_10615 [Pseudomonas sp. TH31]|nr:hypothetical protein [Pseudomonas sp. TH31]